MSQLAGNEDVPLKSVVTGAANKNSNDGAANLKLLSNERTDGNAVSLAGNPLIPDPMSEIPGSPPDFNVYRNKKTLTQGLMDLALFSANANQLRYVLENGNGSVASFYIAAGLIIMSLILQIGVGLVLLMSVQYNVTIQCQRKTCYKYGNYASIGIFLITVVNVFIVAFGNVTSAELAAPIPFDNI